MTANVWLKSLCCSFLVLLLPAVARAIEEEIGLDLKPPVAGSLVICGGGDVPDSVMLRFIELAGGPNAHIVYIPTAAECADSDEPDEDLLFFRDQPLASVSVLHTRDRRQADDPEFLKPLKRATGVWLGGGCQRVLADIYRDTGVETHLREVFQRGGVVGGVSAGAAVMSPLMIRGGGRRPETGPGFGLLPGTVIDQHFLKRRRQDRLLQVLAANPGYVGIGIDEGTALVVQGSRLTVMGDSNVVTCLAASADWPEEVQHFQPGEEIDLTRWIRLAWMRTQPAENSATSAQAVASRETAAPIQPAKTATSAAVRPAPRVPPVRPTPVIRHTVRRVPIYCRGPVTFTR